MAQINEKAAEKVADVLKAIAHPVRLRIIELLENDEKCVGDIVESVGGKLNMMKDKGVLDCRRDGTKVYYRIANRNVIKVLHCVYDHCETE